MMAWILLAYVAIERLAELPLARRNTIALLAAGAHEVGAAHYPVLVGVHVLWLASLAAWVAHFQPPLHLGWAALYVALQPLRFWVIATLGRYWTTRIVTVPNAPLVKRGPYRFLKHPNYVVVVAEIAILPLALGAWPLAVLFSALNAAALTVRLRVENASLAQRS